MKTNEVVKYNDGKLFTSIKRDFNNTAGLPMDANNVGALDQIAGFKNTDRS